MPSNRPLDYTTTISVEQTAGECQAILARAGASSVAVDYDDDGKAKGLWFLLRTPHGTRHFVLPVDVSAMHAVLVKWSKSGNIPGRLKGRPGELAKLITPAHAAQVAWRVVKDWLEANLALVAAQMATLTEVMLPYLLVDDGHTLWQAYQARENVALTGGSSE